MAAGDPGFGMADADPGLIVGLEGALRPLDFTAGLPVSPARVRRRLRAVVDLTEDLARPGAGDIPHPLAGTAARPSGFVPTLREAGAAVDLPDDPLLTPPAYGRWHAGVPRIADALTTPGLEWLAELNLDLRNRAAAGLGAEVVRRARRSWCSAPGSRSGGSRRPTSACARPSSRRRRGRRSSPSTWRPPPATAC